MSRIKGFKAIKEVKSLDGGRYIKKYEGIDNCVDVDTIISRVDQNFGSKHYNVRVVVNRYKNNGDEILFNRNIPWLYSLAEAREARSRLLESAFEVIDKKNLR